jgi:hypothetical protein
MIFGVLGKISKTFSLLYDTAGKRRCKGHEGAITRE